MLLSLRLIGLAAAALIALSTPSASESGVRAIEKAKVEQLRSKLSAAISEQVSNGEFAILENRSNQYRALYRETIDADVIAASVHGSAPDALHALLNVTFDFALYSQSDQYTEEMKTIFGALVNRGAVDRGVVSTLHRYFVTFRRFEEAAQLRSAFAHFAIEAPLDIIGGPIDRRDGRSILEVDPTGRVLQRAAFNLDSGRRVVIVSHPKCGFSRAAREAISEDAGLARAMAHSAVWLADPFTSLTDDTLAEWRTELPKARLYVADLYSDWPEIDYWRTPTFYFYEDGVLQRRIIGWPKNAGSERLADIRAALSVIGVSVE